MKATVLTALGFMLTSGMHVQGANETVGSSPWGRMTRLVVSTS